MWEQIQANKRWSRLLLTLMFLLMVGMGCALGVLIAPPRDEFDRTWLLLGLGFGCVVFIIQYAIYASAPQFVLFSGMNAQEISKEDLPVLVNVVEEMTIAAGLKKPPRVYVIHEAAPNAFAFGRGEQASVAVTTGLLELVNRDELQGVVAHEIGHIRNRDIDFMTLAAVMLGTIVVLGDISFRLLAQGGAGSQRRSSRSSSRSSGGGFEIVILVVALVFVVVAPFVAQLLYFASSRRREYLADASAAVFTRYPEGLASALEKLAAAPLRMAQVNRAVAPLFIVNPLQRLDADSLFSTHPPIHKRIQILRSMAGASLQHYEQAARKVLGRSILKRSETEGETPQPIAKPTTVEQVPVAAMAGASDIIRARAGYRILPCPGCGLTFKVPASVTAEQIPCPRCGQKVHVPPPGTIVAMPQPTRESVGQSAAVSDSASLAPAAVGAPLTSETPQRAAQPVTLVRRPNQWQTLNCPVCGQKIQISPAFRAPKLPCPQCHTVLLLTEEVA